MKIGAKAVRRLMRINQVHICRPLEQCLARSRCSSDSLSCSELLSQQQGWAAGYSLDLFLACASPAHKNTVLLLVSTSALLFIVLANPGASPCGNLFIIDNPGSSILNFYDLYFAPSEPPCIIWPCQWRGNISRRGVLLGWIIYPIFTMPIMLNYVLHISHWQDNGDWCINMKTNLYLCPNPQWYLKIWRFIFPNICKTPL